MFDVKTHSVVQERQLSLEKCTEEDRDVMRGLLEVDFVQYLDEGRKVVYRTTGDHGVEVYDFETNTKWRFAPRQGEEDYASGVYTLEGGKMIASVDADAVRFWRLEAGGHGQWA